MADWDIKHYATTRNRTSYSAANTFALAHTPFAGGALTANADIVLIMFGRLGGENTTYRQETEIRVGGTAIGRNRIVEPASGWANAGNPVTQIYRYTDAGGASSEVVQLWGRNLDATNRLNVPTLQFLAFNVDDIGTDNYLWGEHTTAEQPGPTTYTGKASITIPAGSTDKWVVFYQGEFDCNNTQDEMYVRLHDGTSAIAHSEVIEEAEDTDEQLHLGGHIIIDGAASAQTITLQIQTGSGVSDYIASRIFAFRYSASEDSHTYTNTATYNIGTIAANIQPFTAQIAGTGVALTGDYMVLGNGRRTKTTLTGSRLSSAWFRGINGAGLTAIVDTAYPDPPTADGGADDAAVASAYSNGIHQVNDYAWTESLTSGDQFTVRAEYYEYSDITTSNDVTFHQVVMFSMQKAAGGLTEVTQNSTLQWNLISEVAQNLTANFDVLNSVSSASELRWNLLNQVVRQTGFQWNIVEAVSQNADLRFDVIQQIAQAFDARWSLLNQIAGTSEYRWNLLNQIFRSTGFQWDTLEQIAQAADLRWSLESALSQVAQSLDSRWNILEGVATPIDLRWSLLEEIAQTADFRWSALESVLRTSDLRWSVLSEISSDSNLRWSFEGAGLTPVQSSADFRWSLLNTISLQSVFQWSILNQVSQSESLTWDVLEEVFGAGTLSWDVLNEITQNAELRFSILAEIASSATLSWDLISKIAQSTDLRWNIAIQLFEVSNSVALPWDLRQRIAQSLSLQWSTLESVAKDITAIWDTLESVGVQGSVRWDILNSVAETLTARYEIADLVSNSIGLRWSGLEFVGDSVRLQWDIDGVVGDPVEVWIARGPSPNIYVAPGVPFVYVAPSGRNTYQA